MQKTDRHPAEGLRYIFRSHFLDTSSASPRAQTYSESNKLDRTSSCHSSPPVYVRGHWTGLSISERWWCHWHWSWCLPPNLGRLLRFLEDQPHRQSRAWVRERLRPPHLILMEDWWGYWNRVDVTRTVDGCRVVDLRLIRARFVTWSCQKKKTKNSDSASISERKDWVGRFARRIEWWLSGPEAPITYGGRGGRGVPCLNVNVRHKNLIQFQHLQPQSFNLWRTVCTARVCARAARGTCPRRVPAAARQRTYISIGGFKLKKSVKFKCVYDKIIHIE